METDNFEVVPNQVVEDAKAELVDRGIALEMLLGSPGWKFLTTYISNNIKAFSNRAIKQGFDSMEVYQFERGKIYGLSNLLAEIESSIQQAKDAKKPS